MFIDDYECIFNLLNPFQKTQRSARESDAGRRMEKRRSRPPSAARGQRGFGPGFLGRPSDAPLRLLQAAAPAAHTADHRHQGREVRRHLAVSLRPTISSDRRILTLILSATSLPTLTLDLSHASLTLRKGASRITNNKNLN